MRAIRGSSGTCWCGEVYSAGAMVVAAVEKDEQLALNRVGLVLIDPDNAQAAWVLRTTFWEQTFLPGKEIVSSTVTSRSVGQSFFGKESLALDSYNTKYCVDQDFVTTARAKLDQRTSPENPYLEENRISYVLTTANNWASPIKSFRVVVDKAIRMPWSASACNGVRKVSATEFEMTATDFTPRARARGADPAATDGAVTGPNWSSRCRRCVVRGSPLRRSAYSRRAQCAASPSP
jgi:Domain of unknown function (DUF4424)